jgi:endonuclease YncB( thermonuclease family)
LLRLGFFALGFMTARPDGALGAGPTIDAWLNQMVRLHDTSQARDRPAADGKPVGEIRRGAEVKAIGLVAGKSWVQVELPDHTLAYLPVLAIELEDAGAATAAPPAPQAVRPTALSPPAVPAAAASVRGAVSKVPNAATLVVGDQRVRLSGIDPGPPAALGPFERWVEAQGALVCEPQAHTGRYRCLTGGGIDVAQAAILNGAGRVGDGASPAYRESETEARSAKRGFWGQP